MSIEAYTVSYDTVNYQAPIPVGASCEEIYQRREEGIRDNILRYLGEYRLGVKFDEFFYREEKDPLTGETHLASQETGAIRDVFRHAIKSREEKGFSVRREVAECLGFQKLEQELLKTSNPSKLFIWISPPGQREDGYGLYSFTFVGQIINSPEGRKIRVVPYRNVTTLETHRQILSHFSDRAQQFGKDTDFLSNPIALSPNEEIEKPEDIIGFIGEQEKFNIDWTARLRARVGFLIDGYIDLVKNGASENELLRARNAIENYTIKIKEEIIIGTNNITSNQNITSAKRIFDDLGDTTPPPVAGSCGSTLMEHHEENNKKWEYHMGDCVVCHATGIEVGPCSICKACEKEFDAKEKPSLPN